MRANAAEAVAPVYGHQAGRFAAAIAAVQAILGDHQDSVVAEACCAPPALLFLRHAWPPGN